MVRHDNGVFRLEEYEATVSSDGEDIWVGGDDTAQMREPLDGVIEAAEIVADTDTIDKVYVGDIKIESAGPEANDVALTDTHEPIKQIVNGDELRQLGEKDVWLEKVEDAAKDVFGPYSTYDVYRAAHGDGAHSYAVVVTTPTNVKNTDMAPLDEIEGGVKYITVTDRLSSDYSFASELDDGHVVFFF